MIRLIDFRLKINDFRFSFLSRQDTGLERSRNTVIERSRTRWLSEAETWWLSGVETTFSKQY